MQVSAAWGADSATASAPWRQVSPVTLLVYPNSCLQMALISQSSCPLPEKKKWKGKKPFPQKVLPFLFGRRPHRSKTLLSLYHKWAKCSHRGSHCLVGSVTLVYSPKAVRCFPSQWSRQLHPLTEWDTVSSRYPTKCKNCLWVTEKVPSELEHSFFFPQSGLRYILEIYI